MFLENYLKRIAYYDDVTIDRQTLASLHRKHLYTVPFENLDIHLGRQISLDFRLLETKIVQNRRGGFCYELNGAFYALLKGLGFDVKMISARVYGDGKIGQEFDHMALVVSLGEDWLVDVGFGENFMEPICLKEGVVQEDSAGYFVIERHETDYLRLSASWDGRVFLPQYLFTLTEQQLDDYTEMCHYHQTSPHSSFTRERICTLATEDGRITLRDMNFIETVGGKKVGKPVVDEVEYKQILRDRFQIDL